MLLHNCRNNKGVALVTSLLMMVISLAIVISVLYLVTQGTSVSSLTRQYSSAREAGHGGASLTGDEIIPRVVAMTAASLASAQLGTYGGRMTYPGSFNTCFPAKLRPQGEASPANWNAAAGQDCGDTSMNLSENNSDFYFTLSGTASAAPFRVFVKIVDSTEGNTSTSGFQLDSGDAVVGSGSGETPPPPIPRLYRVEILAQRANNPDERAVLTGLYAH